MDYKYANVLRTFILIGICRGPLHILSVINDCIAVPILKDYLKKSVLYFWLCGIFSNFNMQMH